MTENHTLQLLREIRETQSKHTEALESIQIGLHALAMSDQARHTEQVRNAGDMLALAKRVERIEKRLDLQG